MAPPSCKSTVQKITGLKEDQVCDKGITAVCKMFTENPTVNPVTGRAIKDTGPIYKAYQELCKVVKSASGVAKSMTGMTTKATKAAKAKGISSDSKATAVPTASPEDIERMTKHIQAHIRDEVIIRLGNSIKGEVIKEVAQDMKDAVLKEVMANVKSTIEADTKEAVRVALVAAKEELRQLSEAMISRGKDASAAITKETASAISNITASMTDAVTASLRKDLEKLWKDKLSREVMDSLGVFAERRLKEMVNARLEAMETQMMFMTDKSKRIPHSLDGKTVAFHPDIDKAKIKRISLVVIGQGGQVVDPERATSDLFIVNDKNVPLAARRFKPHSILFSFEEFNALYASFIPPCSTGKNDDTKLVGKFVYLQQGYRNGAIERFVKQCKGNVIDSIEFPNFTNINIYITDPDNPNVTVLVKDNTEIMTPDEFMKKYMMKCLTNNLLKDKVFSYAPGYVDDSGIADFVKKCGGKFRKSTDTTTKVDFVISDDDDSVVKGLKTRYPSATIVRTKEFFGRFIRVD